MAIIKNLQTINVREGVNKKEHSYTVGGNVTWNSHYGEQYGISLKSTIRAIIWSTNPTPGHISRETHSLRGYIHPKFIAVLFAITKT